MKLNISIGMSVSALVLVGVLAWLLGHTTLAEGILFVSLGIVLFFISLPFLILLGYFALILIVAFWAFVDVLLSDMGL